MRFSQLAFISIFFMFSTASNADDTMEKITFIQSNFDQEYDHSLYWQYGWLSIMAANTAVNVAVWATADGDEDKKLDGQVGTFTGLLATGSLLLEPMDGYYYADKLRGMPHDTQAERDATLQQGEAFMRKIAKRERHEKSWVNRLLSAAVNLGAAAVIWQVGDRPKDALISLTLGTVVTEIKIYTSPTTMMDALDAYEKGNYEMASYYLNRPTGYGWQLSAAGSNVQLAYHF